MKMIGKNERKKKKRKNRRKEATEIESVKN